MSSEASSQSDRPRARDVGIAPGIFATGTDNAITDLAGVRVGHATVWEGDSVRTGVTVILPHEGDLYHERVPAAIYTVNGFGKLIGVTQVRELGELETPIALTCTLCVWRVADAITGYLLARPGMEEVRSLNPVVGETNDGFLNNIRARPVRREHVRAALESARTGPVAEGAVGAGTGTRAFGWKGGIGTSSRVLPESLGAWTVGVLIQSNFGGILEIAGAPVGRELGRYIFQRHVEPGGAEADPTDPGDGSIMIVVATDAPLGSRNLARLASRAVHGLARTGTPSTNGSGDYVIAFSTAESVRRRPGEREPRRVEELPNDAMSPLFQAVVEATEEAIYNSLFKAVTVTGHRGTVEALPLQQTLEILERHGAIRR
ncbi:MAG: P1 family peptidase [Gemmatimonadetes bacterium]|uniref:P1 family peptidase n=1 Tax=Candidatus Kutchimonas denitrificans TaxID=3056748 RepID=A0AAE4Z8Q3_9BACT|nr:P1 family peptidase [Gemmatimonadota bacterium]NIR74712.1 P1 family peptidase [Candidatus Kutchimonas denitrificans]NIS01462.1 P1 family peptidase [Gemmatimonadota bacterium]NIT67203.1 P1 family peptidase [Gemmatimonadota bacterium]NIU52377.1 S58 family peptidase [Gemmatimonadota bacterium]